MLSKFVDTKYQCNNLGCSPSITVPASDLINCAFVCLTNTQCRTVTFNESNNQCEVFSDVPSQYGNLLAQTGVVTMTDTDGTSARK
jgi:hypothetical protein